MSFTPSFLRSIPIDMTLVRYVAHVDHARGRQQLFQTQTPELLEQLRTIATVESTESSTRLEGAVAPRERIEGVVLRDAAPQDRHAGLGRRLCDHRRRRRDPPSVLLVALAVLDFLCIHPFADGNGRAARLLTLLLLYHHGYEVGRYVSLERIIEESRETYYETLEASSVGWHDDQHEAVGELRSRRWSERARSA